MKEEGGRTDGPLVACFLALSPTYLWRGCHGLPPSPALPDALCGTMMGLNPVVQGGANATLHLWVKSFVFTFYFSQ